MAREFSVGDHVRWDSEAGRVQGTITSDTTDHAAMHTSDVLTKI